MIIQKRTINHLLPIDRATLIAAMKYLMNSQQDKSLEDISNRYQITKTKTEKLLNFGIELDFIEIEVKVSSFVNNIEYRRFSLTEEGSNFLNRNQS